ncbi:bifunctional Domain of unknown function DUF676 [Babesia duncani]|uniref:DUF676 domain-containing protein n=1 Tax=Babesia duncani TaxID=323732 RepID=A0AAD9PIT6_9APIC|nr:bifunctional Domain of unknown function DUF676 [Babesia duncani]
MGYEWSRRPYAAPFMRDMIYSSDFKCQEQATGHEHGRIGYASFSRHVPFSTRVSELPLAERNTGYLGNNGGFFYLSFKMSICGQIEIAIQVDRISSIRFHERGWYRLEFRVFTQCKNETIPAVPYVFKDGNDIDRRNGTSKVFGAPPIIASDVNHYMSKLFFVGTDKILIDLNEITQFRIMLPASVSILTSLCLFVECTLYRCKKSDTGVYEYVECCLERGLKQCTVHFMVHCCILSFKYTQMKLEPECYRPGPNFLYWQNMLKSSDKNFVYKWFCGCRDEVYKFYKDVDGTDDIIMASAVPLDLICDKSLIPKVKDLFLSTHLYWVFSKSNLNDIKPNGEYFPHVNCDSVPFEQMLKCPQCLEFLVQSLHYIYTQILYNNAVNISMRILRNNQNILEPISDTNLGWLQFKGIVEFIDGTPVCSKEEKIKNEYLFNIEPSITHECHILLSHELNKLMEELNISACGTDHVYISLSSSLKAKFKKLQLIDCNVKAFFRDVQKSIWGESSFLYIIWDIYLQSQISTSMDVYNSEFWQKQSDVLRRISNPNYTLNDLQCELDSWNISDEHQFFLADAFPFCRINWSPYECKSLCTNPSEHLIFLVHGYNGEPWSMIPYWNNLTTIGASCACVLSTFNCHHDDSPIDEMGKMLAREVKAYFASNKHRKIRRLSFVGHSLGGLVIRSAIRHLEEYKNLFYAFISLTAPHLGFAYCQNKIFQTGVRLFSRVKSSSSLKEMTLMDESKPRDRFLYKLSLDDNIRSFKFVRLVGIVQDQFCNLNSAIVKPMGDLKEKKYAHEMSSYLLERMGTNRVDRIVFDYSNASRYITGWMGRSVHIDIIDRTLVIRIILLLMNDIF